MAFSLAGHWHCLSCLSCMYRWSLHPNSLFQFLYLPSSLLTSIPWSQEKMEWKQSWEAAPRRVSGCSFRCLLIICCLVTLLSCHGTVAYKNYTVGDSLGWFDSLMKPAVDYQKWAAGKSFGLGDFLCKFYICHLKLNLWWFPDAEVFLSLLHDCLLHLHNW